MGHECRLVVVELAKADGEELVVVLGTCLRWRQLHTDIVAREAMHGSSTGGFFEEHLGRLSDVTGIEGLCLLVGELQQPVRTQLLFLIADDVGDAQCSGTRAL